MYGMLITPADPHWSYEDPSGIPDEVAVAVRMPEPLLQRVQAAAARDGITPASWLLELVARALSSRPTAA